MAAMVLVILGGRWTVIDRFGIDLPEWDQWDAEGLHMLLPWLQHRPILPELFTPQNEHYVVLTKLLNFTLTLASGQWDQRLESSVNAFLPALLAVMLLGWSRTFLRSQLAPLLALFLAAIWAAPLAWQNVIAGFHSQQFFLIVLAFVTIRWLPFAPAGSWRWWLGTVASIASLLSMASGFFAAVVVLGIVVSRWWRRETPNHPMWPAGLVAVLVVMTGWLTHHEVAYHASLRAGNLHDFWSTLVGALQWPASSAWLALVLWLPWLLLAFTVVRRRGEFGEEIDDWALLGLGAWVVLQVIATAYARGAGGPPPAARYIDTLVFGAVVNALSLAWLDSRSVLSSAIAGSTRGFRRSRSEMVLCVYAALWLLVFFAGAARVYHRALNEELPERGEKRKSVLVRTRAYLKTRDLSYLDFPEAPYPGAQSCADRAGRAEFAAFLPVSVRPAVRLAPEKADGPFVRVDHDRAMSFDPTSNFGVIPGVTIERTDDLPPRFRTTWSSFDSRADAKPAVWTSETIPRPELHGWFLVPLAGARGATLELISAQSGEILAVLHPSTGDRWHATPVRAPDEPFYVRARSPGSGTWIGFGEPIAMSTLSFLAWQACIRAPVILVAGAVAWLACGMGAWLAAIKSRRGAR